MIRTAKRGPFRLIDWGEDGERSAEFTVGRFSLVATTSSIYAERKATFALLPRVVWVTWR